MSIFKKFNKKNEVDLSAPMTREEKLYLAKMNLETISENADIITKYVEDSVIRCFISRQLNIITGCTEEIIDEE